MITITTFASGSRGNCYYITDGNTPLLLEAGIKLKDIQQKLNFQLSSIAGVLVSHEHKDHCKAAQDIIKAGIDCYMSQECADALRLYGHHRIRIVEAKEKFSLGTWTVLPFPVEHDVPALGFLLANTAGDKLLYITDSAYSRWKFNGLTHIMIETNYSLAILNENIEAGLVPAEMKARLLRTHFSLENAKDMLLANDLSLVKEIHLLHLSGNNSDAELFKREVQKLTGKPTYIAG